MHVKIDIEKNTILGASWASLGLSQPPVGTLLASPWAVQIVPEVVLWPPVVPKDLPRGPKRAPGPSRDAFLAVFSHFWDPFLTQNCDFHLVSGPVVA